MAEATLTRVPGDIVTLDPDELLMVEQAIRARLPERIAARPTPTPAEIEAANAMLRETMVTLPHAIGVDNEDIDADLAREYGSHDHHFEQEGLRKLL